MTEDFRFRSTRVKFPHWMMLINVQMSEMVIRFGHRRAAVSAAAHLAGDFALLQELLRVQGVEGSKVVDHRHQLREDCGLIRMLWQQYAAQNHFQLVLHSLQQFWIAESRTVWKREMKNFIILNVEIFLL